jgi:hypothetical protein
MIPERDSTLLDARVSVHWASGTLLHSHPLRGMRLTPSEIGEMKGQVLRISKAIESLELSQRELQKLHQVSEGTVRSHVDIILATTQGAIDARRLQLAQVLERLRREAERSPR